MIEIIVPAPEPQTFWEWVVLGIVLGGAVWAVLAGRFLIKELKHAQQRDYERRTTVDWVQAWRHAEKPKNDEKPKRKHDQLEWNNEMLDVVETPESEER